MCLKKHTNLHKLSVQIPVEKNAHEEIVIASFIAAK